MTCPWYAALSIIKTTHNVTIDNLHSHVATGKKHNDMCS